MTRLEARQFLMEIIFQMEINKDFDEANILNYMKQKNNRGQEKYISSSLQYLCRNIEQINELINNNSPKWKVNRIAKVDLAIIRLSICEQNCEEKVPASVSINEAVNLAKLYGDNNSQSFVNGVLGSIANEK